MKKIKKSQIISGSLSSLEPAPLQRASITPASKVHGSLTGGGSSVIEEVKWGSITGNINNQTDLKNKLDEKQHVLTAGTNVTIENNVISATAGEPEQYVKDASVEGNVLTLTKKVGDPIEFTGGPDEYLKKVEVDSEGNTLTITDQSGNETLFAPSSEPNEYLKKAEVDGNTLKLTNKDGSTTEFTPQGGSGIVKDVLVNGESVLDSEGNAIVTVPTKTSDITNDSGFITKDVHNLTYYADTETMNASITGHHDATKQDVIITEKGIVKNNQTIGLTQTFYDYLENATYLKPTIATFNIKNAAGSNVNGDYELGTTVTVAKVNHKETNKDSINGNIVFKQGSTQKATLTPTNSDTTITLDSSINVTSNTTFYLTATDTKGNALSANKAINFYRYAYIALSTSETAPTSGTKKTAVSTFANSGTSVNYAAGQYLYLYTDTSGKTPATYVAGSWAPVSSVESTVNNFVQANGATHTYYAYRIGPFGSSGTATYRV